MKKKGGISVKDLVVVTSDLVEREQSEPTTMDSFVDDLEKREASAIERRAAMRKISASMLRKLLRRIELDGDSGGLLPVDMVLRYMRFVMDLDASERSVSDEVDPIEFLEKITGLPKEMIVSLYHTSSLEKFKEVTDKRSVKKLPVSEEQGDAEEEETL